MFRTPVALVGLAGIFFVAGSFVPASFSTSPQAQSKVLPGASLPPNGGASGKSHRIGRPVPASSLASVSIVELVGVDQATVILRGRDGEVLYKSDPRSGITILARDTDLPVVTLKEEMRAPVVQHPANRREGNEAPTEQKPKRRHPIGCIGDVSPLVKANADRMPSLCLASLERPLS